MACRCVLGRSPHQAIRHEYQRLPYEEGAARCVGGGLAGSTLDDSMMAVGVAGSTCGEAIHAGFSGSARQPLHVQKMSLERHGACRMRAPHV